MTHFKVVLLTSVTWQWGETPSRDRELKFPLRANRNLTLPITLLSPPGSTLGRALEEIASDVIYFTVLFLSFSFLPPSLLPYLFMMFAVIGSGLSGHVVEILISSLASFFFFFFPLLLYNHSSTFSFPVLHLSLWVDAWPAHFTGSSSCCFFFKLFSILVVAWFFSPVTRFWRHTVASLSLKALSVMR